MHPIAQCFSAQTRAEVVRAFTEGPVDELGDALYNGRYRCALGVALSAEKSNERTPAIPFYDNFAYLEIPYSVFQDFICRVANYREGVIAAFSEGES